MNKKVVIEKVGSEPAPTIQRLYNYSRTSQASLKPVIVTPYRISSSASLLRNAPQNPAARGALIIRESPPVFDNQLPSTSGTQRQTTFNPQVHQPNSVEPIKNNRKTVTFHASQQSRTPTSAYVVNPKEITYDPVLALPRASKVRTSRSTGQGGNRSKPKNPKGTKEGSARKTSSAKGPASQKVPQMTKMIPKKDSSVAKITGEQSPVKVVAEPILPVRQKSITVLKKNLRVLDDDSKKRISSVASFLEHDTLEKGLEVLDALDDASLSVLVTKVMDTVNNMYGDYLEEALTNHLGPEKYQEIARGQELTTFSEFLAQRHDTVSKESPGGVLAKAVRSTSTRAGLHFSKAKKFIKIDARALLLSEVMDQPISQCKIMQPKVLNVSDKKSSAAAVVTIYNGSVSVDEEPQEIHSLAEVDNLISAKVDSLRKQDVTEDNFTFNRTQSCNKRPPEEIFETSEQLENPSPVHDMPNNKQIISPIIKRVSDKKAPTKKGDDFKFDPLLSKPSESVLETKSVVLSSPDVSINETINESLTSSGSMKKFDGFLSPITFGSPELGGSVLGLTKTPEKNGFPSPMVKTLENTSLLMSPLSRSSGSDSMGFVESKGRDRQKIDLLLARIEGSSVVGHETSAMEQAAAKTSEASSTILEESVSLNESAKYLIPKSHQIRKSYDIETVENSSPALADVVKDKEINNEEIVPIIQNEDLDETKQANRECIENIDSSGNEQLLEQMEIIIIDDTQIATTAEIGEQQISPLKDSLSMEIDPTMLENGAKDGIIPLKTVTPIDSVESNRPLPVNPDEGKETSMSPKEGSMHAKGKDIVVEEKTETFQSYLIQEHFDKDEALSDMTKQSDNDDKANKQEIVIIVREGNKGHRATEVEVKEQLNENMSSEISMESKPESSEIAEEGKNVVPELKINDQTQFNEQSNEESEVISESKRAAPEELDNPAHAGSEVHDKEKVAEVNATSTTKNNPSEPRDSENIEHYMNDLAQLLLSFQASGSTTKMPSIPSTESAAFSNESFESFAQKTVVRIEDDVVPKADPSKNPIETQQNVKDNSPEDLAELLKEFQGTSQSNLGKECSLHASGEIEDDGCTLMEVESNVLGAAERIIPSGNKVIIPSRIIGNNENSPRRTRSMNNYSLMNNSKEDDPKASSDEIPTNSAIIGEDAAKKDSFSANEKTERSTLVENFDNEDNLGINKITTKGNVVERMTSDENDDDCVFVSETRAEPERLLKRMDTKAVEEERRRARKLRTHHYRNLSRKRVTVLSKMIRSRINKVKRTCDHLNVLVNLTNEVIYDANIDNMILRQKLKNLDNIFRLVRVVSTIFTPFKEKDIRELRMRCMKLSMAQGYSCLVAKKDRSIRQVNVKVDKNGNSADNLNIESTYQLWSDPTPNHNETFVRPSEFGAAETDKHLPIKQMKTYSRGQKTAFQSKSDSDIAIIGRKVPTSSYFPNKSEGCEEARKSALYGNGSNENVNKLSDIGSAGILQCFVYEDKQGKETTVISEPFVESAEQHQISNFIDVIPPSPEMVVIKPEYPDFIDEENAVDPLTRGQKLNQITIATSDVLDPKPPSPEMVFVKEEYVDPDDETESQNRVTRGQKRKRGEGKNYGMKDETPSNKRSPPQTTSKKEPQEKKSPATSKTVLKKAKPAASPRKKVSPKENEEKTTPPPKRARGSTPSLERTYYLRGRRQAGNSKSVHVNKIMTGSSIIVFAFLLTYYAFRSTLKIFCFKAFIAFWRSEIKFLISTYDDGKVKNEIR